MAITVNQQTISTSAVLLYTATNQVRVSVSNSNGTAANTLAIGGTSGVVAGTGHLIMGGATIQVDMPPGGTLYAIRGGAADVVATVWAPS